MAQYKEIYPEISIITKGVPNPTILRTLQSVARDFYRRSTAYRHTIAATDVPAEATAIALTLPADTELHAPVDMTFFGNTLYTTNVARANSALGRWDDPIKATAKPTGVMRVTSSELALVPLPSGASSGELRGIVAVIPTRTAEQLADEQFDEHYKLLAYGAIAELAAMKNTDWYAPEIISYYTSRFEAGIIEAERRAMNEHTHNHTVVTYGGL